MKQNPRHAVMTRVVSTRRSRFRVGYQGVFSATVTCGKVTRSHDVNRSPGASNNLALSMPGYPGCVVGVWFDHHATRLVEMWRELEAVGALNVLAVGATGADDEHRAAFAAPGIAGRHGDGGGGW